VAMAMFLLMRSAHRTINPKLRRQIRVIRYGLVFGLMLYTGGELLPNAFGVPLGRAVSLPLITVSLFVGAVSIVVAIVRLGFLDVSFIVRRGLVYALASGLIVALYLAAGRQFDHFSAQLVGQPVPLLETTFLVLSLFLLQPLLSGVERLVDRGYSRDRSDLRNALTRLSAEVSLLLDPAEVARVVAVSIRREMVLDRAAVVWRDRRSDVFTCVISGTDLVTEPNWIAGRPLFEALEGRHDAVSCSELLEAPRAREDRETLADTLGAIDAQTAFPLVSGAPGSDGTAELVGVLLLGRKITRTRIPFEEAALVSFIARQVGTSLMNGAMHHEQLEVRLLQEEVATARRIQQQLLPPGPPVLDGWDVAASNSPSRHVGGDYHDFIPLHGGELGFAIGDVSGKGVPAALLMSNLQAALRVRTLGEVPLPGVVQDVNRTICRNTGSESFISFFLGSLDPGSGSFRFTNAGHNAPLLVRRNGSVETLEAGGLLLGVFPEATYEQGEVDLQPGDLLMMYTDGVTEASNAAGDMYSEERLVDALVRLREHDAHAVHRHVLEEVRTFQAGVPPDDDLTVVVLKRTGNGTPPS
ncbi:PP2C family protein-serine/threonine phosphatase, partial [bacterium]|nr:PP2C family protein-serine/threonine phosphatase [bacterium]